MLRRLLDAGAPLHQYRRVVTGAAPLLPNLRARAEAAGVPIVDSYGQSETWAGIVLDGIPISTAAVRLADDGEIQVHGPTVMQGYRNDPSATDAARTPDGWLRTGDLGARDADGRFRFVDRRDDLVISGGVNVSPTEVESVLARHPAVSDVAVAGASDPEWGQRVVAYVVPVAGHDAPDLATLRGFAAEQLAAPKLPRELILVDEIPRTPGGKIRRRTLAPREPSPRAPGKLPG
jgi:O-succinylbenzoic acid--CoA ligase